MSGLNIRWMGTCSFALAMIVLLAGCMEQPETRFSSNTKSEEPVTPELVGFKHEGQRNEVAASADFQPLKLELQPSREERPQFVNDFSPAPRPSATRSRTIRYAQPKTQTPTPQFAPPSAPVAVQKMAVMSAGDVETELPPSQTTIDVFYATDRKSKFGVTTNDWINIHFGTLIALGVYLISFVGVFVSQRKVLLGAIAFGSLAIFLVLGQAAMVQWQQQQNLAKNGDAIYVSEIRPANSPGTLDYGTCEVTIPPDHKIGHIDSPSLFKLEFTETPEKHVVLHRVTRNDSKDGFYDELNETIERSEGRQALVFIHGYNVSFENAVKRTAQIVHDLEFDGAPICYSWSSAGALANYTKDMANADATVVALQSFLEETVRRTGNTTIHLVAHSMGNRALLQALDRIAVGSSRANKKMFGQLVMAAPDVSAVDFKNRFAPSAIDLAKSVTLYASSRDRALIASTEIHGHNRAGLAGDDLVVMQGVDTIDVSGIDTSLIGHSYYGDHPELIRDLRALVELAQPASSRQWLHRITSPGSLDYFRFTEHEFRSASEFQETIR